MFSWDFLIRYGFFFVSILVLLRGIYFRASPNREAYLGFFLFGNGVFLVTFLLHNIEMSMGFAFGLFAVFAMLRYRTEPITIRDMTYLFTVIVLSLICSVSQLNYLEFLVILILICSLAAFGETNLFAPRVIERKINYDRVDNIKPGNHADLIEDLKSRTGLNIVKVEIVRIDYLTDSAQIIAFCSDDL